MTRRVIALLALASFAAHLYVAARALPYWPDRDGTQPFLWQLARFVAGGTTIFSSDRIASEGKRWIPWMRWTGGIAFFGVAALSLLNLSSARD